MKTISQLDQHHTNVTGHGEKHAAQVLGLLLRAVDKMNAPQFCDAIDKCPHLTAELGLKISRGHTTVLNHIMEKTCSNHGWAHAKLLQRLCNGKGMTDVGLPTGPLLPPVLLPGKVKSSGNQSSPFLRSLVVVFRRRCLVQTLHQPDGQRKTVMLLQPLSASGHNLPSSLGVAATEHGGARGFQNTGWSWVSRLSQSPRW